MIVDILILDGFGNQYILIRHIVLNQGKDIAVIYGHAADVFQLMVMGVSSSFGFLSSSMTLWYLPL